MSELNFYLSQHEEQKVAQEIFSAGAYMVPEKRYSSRAFDIIRTDESLNSARNYTRFFFCLHENFSRSPLGMEQVEGEEGHFVFIKQRHGGPTLDLLFGVRSMNGNNCEYAPGFLAYHNTYWDPVERKMKEPDEELVKLYKTIARVIKSISVRIKPAKKIYWLGRELREEFNEGSLLIGLEHLTKQELYRYMDKRLGKAAGGPGKDQV